MTMSEEESEEFRILRDAIDVRRDDMERNENLNEFRRALARIIKPTALFASVTPYDAALGDLAYAAGELLDPEGDPELAAMAAGAGLLTGGVGSGAMAARMARIPRKVPKKVSGTVSTEQHLKDLLRKDDILSTHPSTKDRIKNLDLNAPLPKDLPPTVKDRIKKVIQNYLGKLPEAAAQTLAGTSRAYAAEGMEDRPFRDTVMDIVRAEMAGESYYPPPNTVAEDLMMPSGFRFKKPKGFDDLTDEQKEAYFKARKERMQKIGERMLERRNNYQIDAVKRSISKDESNDGYVTDEMITDYMLSNNIRF